MNLNLRNQLVFCLAASLISILTSCAPAPTPSPAASSSPVPTHTAPTIQDGPSSPFQAGRRYSDTSEDMAVSFLDVVAFRADINEEAETLDVLLQLRDIPDTADLGQVTNLVEYAWTVNVYLDPTESDPANLPGDYYLSLNTSVDDPSASGNSLTPVPGQAEQVPFHQLFENRYIYNSAGQTVETVQVEISPDRNTLLFTGRVPGITSNAVFTFGMFYYDGTMDRPDNFVPLAPALPTPLSEITQTPQPSPAIMTGNATTDLIPAGAVRAYPGPEHYAGDVLTFEIMNDGSFGDETLVILMTLDNGQATQIATTEQWYGILLPLAFDTAGLSGKHTLRFTTSDGRLNETYSFEVLPAEQRPANEKDASWQVHETNCCIMHSIAHTAAARDIDFIAEHFQQAAADFATITGSEIDPKLNVYIIDRMWGNGGFGGDGKLSISYSDRYYGPTVGAEGLETLARHEFTHAANLDWSGGAGVEFNYEGLAVYVAGGHYKPEPLAERGAALLDLGRYVPVGQFLNQHELDYLYPAAMLTYIVETYGMEKMWKFLVSDENPQDFQPGPLEPALQATFGISLEEFDRDFQAWLDVHEPGEQLEDLRLTIELQDLRRQYQNTYSPSPNFLQMETLDAVTRPDYLPIVMREARAPANIAIELIIANAQRAITAGAYAEAEELNKSIKEVISTGRFEDPLAKEYLDIVVAAADTGYEVLTLNIQNGYATAQVTNNPPETTILELQKVDGVWQVQT